MSESALVAFRACAICASIASSVSSFTKSPRQYHCRPFGKNGSNMDWREAMGRAAEIVAPSSSLRTDGGFPVAQVNDLSRSLTAFDPISTLVVVVEMSKASWLVSGVVPGVERQPLKKLEPDATALLRLIERWRNEAV